MKNNLLYRRQFLLTREPIPNLDDWKRIKVANYFLYVHPDLLLTTVRDSSKTLVLLGDLFYPQKPQINNQDILKIVSAEIKDMNGLISAIKYFTGRYVLFYHNHDGINLIHDPLALREVYYCEIENRIVCGSQPKVLAYFSKPNIKESSDPDLLNFMENHLPHQRGGRLWVGDETYYQTIKHLMPNHYFDIEMMKAKRYWPNDKLNEMNISEAVRKSCDYLKGALKAITSRYSVMMAVTSGKDSRSLLAASKDVQNEIYYFINKESHLCEKSADIRIPVKMFKVLNLPFHIHEVNGSVDDVFKKIFLENTFMSTERILPTIYNVYYKHHQDKVNLLGVGEIGREFYGKAPKNIDGYYLARCLKYKNCRYATLQCEKWLQETKAVAEANGVDIMKLFLWEGLLGNWGAVGNSESDIAIEEFDPYDSHYLYEILLSVNTNKYDIFEKMYEEMWPELLDFPINPPQTMKDWIDLWLKRLKIYSVLKLQKYRYDRWKYRKTIGPCALLKREWESTKSAYKNVN